MDRSLKFPCIVTGPDLSGIRARLAPDELLPKRDKCPIAWFSRTGTFILPIIIHYTVHNLILSAAIFTPYFAIIMYRRTSGDNSACRTVQYRNVVRFGFWLSLVRNSKVTKLITGSRLISGARVKCSTSCDNTVGMLQTPLMIMIFRVCIILYERVAFSMVMLMNCFNFWFIIISLLLEIHIHAMGQPTILSICLGNIRSIHTRTGYEKI